MEKQFLWMQTEYFLGWMSLDRVDIEIFNCWFFLNVFYQVRQKIPNPWFFRTTFQLLAMVLSIQLLNWQTFANTPRPSSPHSTQLKIPCNSPSQLTGAPWGISHESRFSKQVIWPVIISLKALWQVLEAMTGASRTFISDSSMQNW